MKNKLSLLALSIVFLTSCKKNEEKEIIQPEIVTTEITATDCKYAIDSTQTTVNWTAFKTSEKIGVNGKFDIVEVTGIVSDSSIVKALSSIKFNIKTSSTNTNNPERDQKIINFFFGKMAKTEAITGHLKTVSGDNTSGKCVAQLRINEIDNDVNLDYTFANDTITLKGTMDVTKWNGNKALDAINNACKALHTGADGKSVTWPNVDVEIKSAIKKECK